MTAADVHREYYQFRFSDFSQSWRRSFLSYFFASFFIVLLGFIMILTYVLNSEYALKYLLPISIYFLSEKIGDECLRHAIFEKKFQKWGKLISLRFFCQIMIMSVFIVLQIHDLPFYFFLGIGLTNILIFSEEFRFINIKFISHFLLYFKTNAQNSLFFIVKKRHLWLFSLTGAMFGYIDRIIIMYSKATALPFFTILVFCMAFIQMGVEFFFLTPLRNEFLNRNVVFFETIVSRQFLKVFFGSITLAFSATSLAYFTFKGASEFPLSIIVLVAINQIFLALISITREILYWTEKINQALFCEISLWVLFGTALFFSKYLGLQFSTQLFIFTIFCFLRFFAYLFLLKDKS